MGPDPDAPQRQATVTAEDPVLSVVVLSYDRPAYLREALGALVAQRIARREIVVVDNRSASSDAVADVVAGFPEVRLLALSANLGFTGGMNVGLAQATGRYVLLTEDDIVVQPGCLEAFLESSRRGRDRAVLTGVILDDGTRRIRCAGGEVALGPPFRMQVIGAGEDLAAVRDEPYQVSFAPGALLFLPRDALRTLGGFRAEYFMYFEDVELCLRAQRLGIPITVVPSARVVHLPPGAGPASSQIEYHKVKNLLATYFLHARLSALPSVIARYVLLEAVRRLSAQPRQFTTFLRACGWACAHAPGLLRARGRGART